MPTLVTEHELAQKNAFFSAKKDFIIRFNKKGVHLSAQPALSSYLSKETSPSPIPFFSYQTLDAFNIAIRVGASSLTAGDIVRHLGHTFSWTEGTVTLRRKTQSGRVRFIPTAEKLWNFEDGEIFLREYPLGYGQERFLILQNKSGERDFQDMLFREMNRFSAPSHLSMAEIAQDAIMPPPFRMEFTPAYYPMRELDFLRDVANAAKRPNPAYQHFIPFPAHATALGAPLSDGWQNGPQTIYAQPPSDPGEEPELELKHYYKRHLDSGFWVFRAEQTFHGKEAIHKWLIPFFPKDSFNENGLPRHGLDVGNVPARQRYVHVLTPERLKSGALRKFRAEAHAIRGKRLTPRLYALLAHSALPELSFPEQWATIMGFAKEIETGKETGSLNKMVKGLFPLIQAPKKQNAVKDGSFVAALMHHWNLLF